MTTMENEDEKNDSPNSAPEGEAAPRQSVEPDLMVDQPMLIKGYITPDGLILKGIDAEHAPFGSKMVWIVCLDSVEVPLSTDDSTEFAQTQCIRTVEHPIMGRTQQFGISTSAGLVMLEVAKALKKRDDRIAKLEALVVRRMGSTYED